jgi:hypothetical protein
MDRPLRLQGARARRPTPTTSTSQRVRGSPGRDVARLPRIQRRTSAPVPARVAGGDSPAATEDPAALAVQELLTGNLEFRIRPLPTAAAAAGAPLGPGRRAGRAATRPADRLRGGHCRHRTGHRPGAAASARTAAAAARAAPRPLRPTWFAVDAVPPGDLGGPGCSGSWAAARAGQVLSLSTGGRTMAQAGRAA